MSAPRASKGPRCVHYFGTVLSALRDLGGSGRPSEVLERVVAALQIPAEQRDVTNKSGQSRLSNDIHWARFYLVKAGFINASRRGVWALTPKGTQAFLSRDDALNVFREVQVQFGTGREADEPEQHEEEPPSDIASASDGDYREALLRVLRELPPAGFERLCQRLLREAGFEEVTVTGRSGDGGIDGHGLLQINPLVSVRVLFQCKRYKDSVSPAQVRDFRGAMSGRTDQGIIMTTGTFTTEARREATRDGVPTIELVDGDRLVRLFERLGLGLRPVHTFALDFAFFSEFQ